MSRHLYILPMKLMLDLRMTEQRVQVVDGPRLVSKALTALGWVSHADFQAWLRTPSMMAWPDTDESCRLTQELDLAQHGVQLAQGRIKVSEGAQLAASVAEAQQGLLEAAEAAKQTAQRQADLKAVAQVPSLGP